ncbi:MAG: hypothetical protein KJ799_06245 [Bacteroidetes bacterium]|nr:hypothetical protein [Bacteroidota bacterium]
MISPNISNWNLKGKGKDLLWNGCSLTDLAKEYETPLYVINKMRLQQSYKDLLYAFINENLNAEIFFSFKTNPIPAVLKSLVEIGSGAEIISEYELWLAQKLGVENSKIIITGSAKSESMLRTAVEINVRMISIDNYEELLILLKTAKQLNKSVDVTLRINPAIRKRMFDLTSETGTKTCPMGFIHNSSEWRNALDLLRKNSYLNLLGLHFHIGSGITNSSPYKIALKKILKIWQELTAEGFSPKVLDIGGGFNIPTLKTFNLLEVYRLYAGNRRQGLSSAKHKNQIVDIARYYGKKLIEFSLKHGIALPEIFLEPGRFISASSQILLLKVLSVQNRGKSKDFLFCDGGAMSLSPLLLSEYHEIICINKSYNGKSRMYNILGNLPTPLDVVGKNRVLPIISPGDILAVMDTGAYFTSLGNNFAGPRPAIVTVENGQAQLIRRRESFDDLIVRDLKS